MADSQIESKIFELAEGMGEVRAMMVESRSAQQQIIEKIEEIEDAAHRQVASNETRTGALERLAAEHAKEIEKLHTQIAHIHATPLRWGKWIAACVFTVIGYVFRDNIPVREWLMYLHDWRR